MNNRFDLIIIGGGVLGTFHAYHALKRGLTVALLERTAAPRGATVRNFGQIVPSGSDRQWQPFGRESLKIYKSIQSKFDITVRELGSIYIASDDQEVALIEELAAINAEDGYASELWSAQKCRDRYPNLRGDYCRGGLFFPEEISVNPRQMIHRLHEYLRSNAGFEVHYQTCVGELNVDERTVLARTSRGQTILADRAIVCSGSEFQMLYPDIFSASDIDAVKLQMARLKPAVNTKLPGNILTGLSIRRYESFAQCPSWKEIKASEPEDSFWKKWGVHILF